MSNVPFFRVFDDYLSIYQSIYFFSYLLSGGGERENVNDSGIIYTLKHFLMFYMYIRFVALQMFNREIMMKRLNECF